jgi:hypothetical protein
VVRPANGFYSAPKGGDVCHGFVMSSSPEGRLRRR